MKPAKICSLIALFAFGIFSSLTISAQTQRSNLLNFNAVDARSVVTNYRETGSDELLKQIDQLRGQWPATYIFPKNTTRVLFSDEPYRFLMVVGDKVIVEDTALDNRKSRRIQLEGIKGSKVTGMAFSKDGRFAGLATTHCTSFWDADNGNLLAKLQENEHAQTVKFSPSGKFLFTATEARDGYVWNGQTGELISKLNSPNDLINLARFNKDESLILTAGSNSSAIIWEVKTGKRIHELKHEGAVTSICFSPDEESILTASSNVKTNQYSLHVWEAKNAKLKFDIDVTSPAIASYRSDGMQLVSVSKDAITWWNGDDGSKEYGIELAGINPKDARFVPDRQHLVVFYEKQALLWTLFDTKPINKFKRVGESVSDSFSGNMQNGLRKFYSLSNMGAFRKWHIKKELPRR